MWMSWNSPQRAWRAGRGALVISRNKRPSDYRSPFCFCLTFIYRTLAPEHQEHASPTVSAAHGGREGTLKSVLHPKTLGFATVSPYEQGRNVSVPITPGSCFHSTTSKRKRFIEHSTCHTQWIESINASQGPITFFFFSFSMLGNVRPLVNFVFLVNYPGP